MMKKGNRNNNNNYNNNNKNLFKHKPLQLTSNHYFARDDGFCRYLG